MLNNKKRVNKTGIANGFVHPLFSGMPFPAGQAGIFLQILLLSTPHAAQNILHLDKYTISLIFLQTMDV